MNDNSTCSDIDKLHLLLPVLVHSIFVVSFFFSQHMCIVGVARVYLYMLHVTVCVRLLESVRACVRAWVYVPSSTNDQS